MNNKAATLGIGAAVIGVAAALVSALASSRPTSAGKRQAGGGTGSTGYGDGAQPVAPAIAGSQPTEADGPSGPTAPARPAPTGDEGHAAPDLAAGGDLGPDHRAPEAFRPDMDAPMTAAEREALRPATGPSPSLVSDEGGSVQGVGGDRY